MRIRLPARRRRPARAALPAARAASLGLLLIPLLAASAAGQGTGAASPPDTVVRTTISGAPDRDPLRGNEATRSPLAREARSAQDGYERTHRIGLRFYNGGADATCEVPLGRICYWNNNGDVPPPAERNDAKVEREALLEVLGRAHDADPADDWINGMRVRYLIEAEHPDSAIAAARACRGTPWWCASLQGLALHDANEHAESRDAFARALAAMPEPQRCVWTDLSWWLDLSVVDSYRSHACGPGRAKENARILRLAQPLWMLPANDLENELYARRTMSRVHSLGRIPYDLQWGDDLLESQVRYGWPTAWSVQNGGVADPRPPSVIGHEPTPSYDFVPEPRALGAPIGATQPMWALTRADARMRYAPRYGSGFAMLPHQFARFRRGDTTLVAGAYRLVRELEMGRAPYTAAFTVDAMDGSTAPRATRRDSASAAGALLMPITAPMLGSLEVYGARGKRASRVRTTITPLPATARLSDFLVLQRGDPTVTPSLERNAAQAFGSLEIDQGATIGLYWEMYRASTPAAPLQIEVRALKLGTSLGQRLGSLIGLSKAVQPVAIQYQDNGRPDGQPGRSVAVTFPPVAAGDYQLSVVVSGGGVADTTSQVIRIRARD